ncbi:MAG: hypothetical protein KJI69_05645 [Patescibacteria group bacterium]|nr:hypothetical protein [Patescibacteria group bacterium]
MFNKIMKKASKLLKKTKTKKPKKKRKISVIQLYEQLKKNLEKKINNKDEDKDYNSKTEFISFLIKNWIKKENRKLFLKWIEMKEEIITEYDFNLWVTRNILDQEEEE